MALKTENINQAFAEKAIVEEIENELKPLFDSLDWENKGSISIDQVLKRLQEAGIGHNDARLGESLSQYLQKDSNKDPQKLIFDDFIEMLKNNSSGLIKKALLNRLSVPDFKELKKDFERYFNKTKIISEGNAKEKEKNLYAVSVCTIDGQKLQLGDWEEKFMLQSVSKPINYAIALHERGEEKVYKHVGREPSGRSYNELVLNQDKIPHNPMMNSGAIMICSLIKPDESVEKRFEHIKDEWSRICGNTPVSINQETFNSSPEDSPRNMAISYYMLDHGAFPENTDIYETMRLYNKCCAIELTVDQLATAAATLANGGICPLTGDKVFASDNVRDCLSLMLSCGMYDYSGEFAFLVGLPAKSGVSGAMMVVVPGLMGIAIYSPPLDELGNPIRGIEFCKELVKEYSLHKYDHIVDPDHKKKDPAQLAHNKVRQ